MNDVFASLPHVHNRKKNCNRIRHKSKKNKLVRRKEYLSKFAKSHKEQMEDTETGKTYRSCVAIKAAKKSTKEIRADMAHNPKGTPMVCILSLLLQCSEIYNSGEQIVWSEQ